ncbi:translocation/assembly module TamB domain-containing protein [Balneatrix alpica]|uniref:Translocation/assembly module TamB domain-containing protein n=1 Tax=Balneatrix alpica TaxID=75684 RepID=A0ABV5ZA59_9GAMM|nr:translocation/assembly module TamB domain-containing protein [Balneatrix alpica]
MKGLLGRWSKRLAILLLCLVLISVLALGWLLGSRSGAQQILVWAASEGVQAAEVEGHLLGRLVLRQLQLQRPEVEGEIDELIVSWQPWQLLYGQVRIDEISLRGARLQLADSPAAEPDTPLTLPAIQLPLRLDLQRLQLAEVTLYPAAAQPLYLRSAQLRAAFDQQGLLIQQLQLDYPPLQAQLQAELQPWQDYPLQAQLSWQLDLAAQGQLQGHGQLQGTLAQQLTLSQQLEGLAQASLWLQLYHPLAEPSWQVNASLQELDWAKLAPQLAESQAQLKLLAEGDLHQYQAELQAQAILPEVGPSQLQVELQGDSQQLQLQQLLVTLADSPARLLAQGQLQGLDTEPQLQLQGQWQQLGYPLAEPLYRSASGRWQLTGSLQQFEASLEAVVAATDLPEAKLSWQGQGDTSGLNRMQLQVDTLGGQLQSRGSVSWQPQLAWQQQLELSQLQPGKHWPELSGTLGGRLLTQGKLATEGVEASLEIVELQGEWQKQPLSGRGLLHYHPGGLRIEQLDLALGQTKLAAHGRLEQQWALQWQLQAPSLAKVLPQMAGQLQASGKLTGSQQAPHLQAQVDGQKLVISGQQLQQLSANVALDMRPGQPANVQLVANKLILAGERWQQLSLDMQGTLEQHQIKLMLQGEPLTTQLHATGGWQQQQWQGQLQQWQLQSADMGQWSLAQAVTIKASAAQAGLQQPLCLLPLRPASAARLCLEGQWSVAEGSQAKLGLSALPLSLLSPYLPGSTAIEGELSMTADLQQQAGQAPRYQAQLQLSPSRFKLTDPKLQVALAQTRLSVQGSQDNVDAQLALKLPDVGGNLNATFSVKGLSREAKLQGEVLARLDDLGLVSVLAPQVQIKQGYLAADLQLAGRLQAPLIQGQLGLYQGLLEIPQAGLVLQELGLTLAPVTPGSATLQLQGQARSGQGLVRLHGELEPQASRGWLTLQGEDFQAYATQDIQAWISPNLRLDWQPQLTLVRGELLIPKAMISPPDLSSATTSSSDTVIVDGSTPEVRGESSRLDVEIRLRLGDQVWVDAFGFNGRLQGELEVRERGRGPRGTGTIEVASGEYELYGQKLSISRGGLVYTGGPLDNPGLDIRALRQVEQVEVGALVSGTLRQPSLKLISQPSMPDASILSYLLLGRAPGTSSGAEQSMLLRAAMALTMKGGNSITQKIATNLNVDELGFDGGEGLGEAAFFIGKYLSPQLYIKYGVGLLEPASQFLIRYKLTDNISFESQTGTNASGADVFYSIEK